jgi:hypothetical protein
VGVAALAAAVAYHRVGAPLAVSLLLGLSAIVLMHGPPIGPIGLVCFATAIVLLARSQRKSRGLRRWRRAQSAAPDLASCLDANAECGGIHTAFDSIWLSDNVGDVVYRVPLHMK